MVIMDYLFFFFFLMTGLLCMVIMASARTTVGVIHSDNPVWSFSKPDIHSDSCSTNLAFKDLRLELSTCWLKAPEDIMDCPSCHSQFPTLDSLTHHFNTQGAQCISALEDGFWIPTPPAFVHGAGETNIQGEFCKYSRYRFGKAGTLMDQLEADKHERHQEHQFYYLFADEGEWDLVQFLVTLTKAQVSRFLKSQWVHLQCTFTASILTLHSSLPVQSCLLGRQTNFSAGLQIFQLDHSGRLPQLIWTDMSQFGMFV